MRKQNRDTNRISKYKEHPGKSHEWKRTQFGRKKCKLCGIVRTRYKKYYCARCKKKTNTSSPSPEIKRCLNCGFERKILCQRR